MNQGLYLASHIPTFEEEKKIEVKEKMERPTNCMSSSGFHLIELNTASTTYGLSTEEVVLSLVVMTFLGGLMYFLIRRFNLCRRPSQRLEEGMRMERINNSGRTNMDSLSNAVAAFESLNEDQVRLGVERILRSYAPGMMLQYERNARERENRQLYVDPPDGMYPDLRNSTRVQVPRPVERHEEAGVRKEPAWAPPRV